MTGGPGPTDASALPGVPDREDGEPDADGGHPLDADTTRETARDRMPADPTQTEEESVGSTTPMPGVPGEKGNAAWGRRSVNDGGESGGETCGAPDHASRETVHDLTTVFTFRALQRFADPVSVIAAARSWSDWVGVVGDEDVPTMNTFMRRTGVQVDFFNGASSPEARLRRVSETDSTFGSKRQVLIGLAVQEGELEAADWEFQPLEVVAEDAEWSLQ